MEIINIEARTFEAMMERFQAFARKINLLCDQSEDKEMKEWLDSQEVCIILDISKRKSQYLRNFQKIPYSMINGKIYYKPEDVRKYIELERGGVWKIRMQKIKIALLRKLLPKSQLFLNL